MGSKQESLLGGSRFHEGDFVFLQTGIMGQKGKTFYFCLGDEHSAKGVSVMWRKVFHSMRMLDGDMKHFKGLTFQNALEIPGNFQFTQRLFDPYFPNDHRTDKNKILALGDCSPRFF
jgi:hypothetical protein